MRRKSYTQGFKDLVIKEALEAGNSALIARRYELDGGLVARWVREFKNEKHKTKNSYSLNYKDQLLYQENKLKKMLGDEEPGVNLKQFFQVIDSDGVAFLIIVK